MSHEILYRTLFVRLSDNTFIPLHEHGSNNVTEVQWNGRERRERNWSNSLFDRKISYTREEIAARIDQIIKEECERWVGRDNYEGGAYTKEEVLKRFSYFSCLFVRNQPTSANQLKNYFVNGCDHCIALTDLASAELHARYDGGDEIVTSEEQLKAFEGRKGYLCTRYDMPDYVYEKAHPKRERKPAVPLKEGFAVRLYHYDNWPDLDNGRYLAKLNAHSIAYNDSLRYGCKIYRTRKQAEEVCAKIKRRYTFPNPVPVAVRTNPDTNRLELAE